MILTSFQTGNGLYCEAAARCAGQYGAGQSGAGHHGADKDEVHQATGANTVSRRPAVALMALHRAAKISYSQTDA
jgi:hypothetical protein